MENLKPKSNERLKKYTAFLPFIITFTCHEIWVFTVKLSTSLKNVLHTVEISNPPENGKT